ncbi:MAG: TonB-dependent receptor [Acidobacteria bacterium]|nr:MAG: TonB-dependent receptor [Acidobacteriota bacterium]
MYVVTNLAVGTYAVAAELSGFRKAQKTGFELTADGRITADFVLGVGSLTETVMVTAVRGETVNRNSGEISRVIDGDQVRELALSGRNFLELASLIPGAVLLEDDQMAITTGLGTGGTVINGARGNTNNLTVDGGFNLDSGSNGSMINNVGLNFIEQVKIQTSNFSAEFGRNSGSSINVVTRSGSNRYSGSGFETYRDESLDAAEHFAPRDQNGKPIKGQLNFNNYGLSFGGPIQRNRFFFFGGVEFKKLDRVDGPFRRTMPTRGELSGDFSRRSTIIRDPLTGQPFPGNVIPTDRITADGRAIANVYEAMINRALQFSDTPTGNNATFQLDFPFSWRQEILKFDYRLNPSHNFYLRTLHDSYDLVEPRGTFIGADLPTISTRRLRPGYGIQLGHSWIVRRGLLNEFKANASWNGQRIPPYGDAWRRDTYGFTFPQVYNGGRYDEGIPNVTISGFASLTGPSASLLSPTTDITGSNTLTWLKNAHTLRVGALVTRNRKDQNGRLAHTGAVNFNPSGNPNSTGLAFADALLGNFRTYSEGADDPLGFFRFTQYSAYASDNWRVKPNLSVEIGLRYELASPTYTQANNIVNFDPALYDATQAITVTRTGGVVPGSGNPYIGLIRAGTEIPEDQLARVTVDNRAAALIPMGAPRGLYDTHHLFMPRFSTAYSLTSTTVLRAGIGLFYDKPEGNVIFSQVNLPPFVPSVSVENANLASPLSGRAAADAVLGTVNAIDPHLNVPRQWNFSVGVQRELASGHFAEITYVGNRGRHLLWFPEINSPSFEDLNANMTLPSAQRANNNFLRPYKGYSSIRQRRSDAFVDYNSLQFYLNRRKGVIRYTLGYTLSKAVGNVGDNSIGGNPEDAFNFDFNTGPTSYDRRHVLVGTWTYQMPSLRDRHHAVGLVLGNWELSGKVRWQSGQYLTPTGNTLIGNRRADYAGGEISLPAEERSQDRWFNTTAFVSAPDTRRGNAEVGTIQGPHLQTWDVSLRKYFRIQKRTRVGLRADMFNALNRVNFSNPNTNLSSGSYGQISDAKPPRQMQLSLQLEF